MQRSGTDFRRAYEIAVNNELMDATDIEAVARLLGCSGSWATKLTEAARAAKKAADTAKIVALKAEGMSNRAIAREVQVDEGTVRNVQKARSAEIPHGAEIPHPDVDAAEMRPAADLLRVYETPDDEPNVGYEIPEPEPPTWKRDLDELNSPLRTLGRRRCEACQRINELHRRFFDDDAQQRRA